MTEFMQGQMVPLTSRVLSAGLRLKEVREVRRRLEVAGALPCSGARDMAGRCVSCVYGYLWLYPVMWRAFRWVFEPFILPRMAKG